jgi:hypothetical protein
MVRRARSILRRRDLDPLESAAREWLLLFMSIGELLPVSLTVVDVTAPEQVVPRLALR